MHRIALIPLDERPCNVLFAPALARMTKTEVITPPIDILGQKKTPGSVDKIHAWLIKQAPHVDGFIIAMDTILYGGIVPSRLHFESLQNLQKRLDIVKKIKTDYPQKPLYGFSLIMRNPTYSNSDEEPDYYQDYGRDIHRKGFIQHKQALNIATKEEIKELISIDASLPKSYFEDYTNRRKVNLTINQSIIKMVADQGIDFLIIPQDDASPYGLTALDQEVVRQSIQKYQVGTRVLIYPGADEVANTLLSRMISKNEETPLKIYIKYTSEGAPHLIPLYEDRPLHETVKYQIIAAGARVATSLNEANILLIVNAPPSAMLNASMAHLRGIEYTAFRNLPETIEAIKNGLEDPSKTVALADVAYANGSDLELLSMLKQEALLFKLGGYAGWNTSSNTLGTAIPMAILRHFTGPSQAHLDFLGWRYAEDAGYCAFVRQSMLPKLKELNLNYFQVDGIRGQVSKWVHQGLEEFLETHINDMTHRVKIKNCWMPWNRMFEVGLEVNVVVKD
jgi:hypothetical protein